jgi:23S rRNA (cytosine1962-C5)-methyltransferase
MANSPRFPSRSKQRDSTAGLRGKERGEEIGPVSIHDAALSAVKLRESLFGPFGREGSTSAYRVLNGEGDGVGDLVVDAYAGFLVHQVTREAALPSAPRLEEALAAILDPRGIVRKHRFLEKERGRVVEEVTYGDKPPQGLIVLEEGMPLEVELAGGFHTGLFSDMREERARLRRLAKGRRVLNLFAYTGAFSVAAALGGATQVTSVDVVAKVLEHAKRNFRLSGLDPGAHHFARMEVLEYLRMAERRGWRFDAIILDPPTYATFKSGIWSVKKDYPELMSLSLSLLEREGLIWAAANTESFPPDQLEKVLVSALRRNRRAARVLALGGLPSDYPTPPSSPQARYLKVLVAQVF